MRKSAGECRPTTPTKKNTENEYVTPNEEGHPVDERIRLLTKLGVEKKLG